MKRKTLLVLAVLLVGYIGLFGFSANGYGYAGHNGYDHGPLCQPSCPVGGFA